MDAAEDFNSSDLEMPAAPPNPYERRGQASALKIMENHFELRKTSKIAARKSTITYSKGAPDTRQKRNYWFNLFKAFSRSALSKE